VLLALFVIHLAAGLYLSLPLIGRRNAGVKFYRLTLIIAGVLTAIAIAAHLSVAPPIAAASGEIAGATHAQRLAVLDASALVLTALVYFVLRYPKRLIFRGAAFLLGCAFISASVLAYDSAIHPVHIAWSVIGSLSTTALLGSVTMAMLLGHWYLVVRGMAIDPLERLTIATLAAAVAKLIVVFAAILLGGAWHEVAVRQGIFFWMRAGWGLAGPLVLYPMIWGTVKIRSTMAATGILYVDVVAVLIGEVLGAWISALVHLPV
jgi:hypothetical protein